MAQEDWWDFNILVHHVLQVWAQVPVQVYQRGSHNHARLLTFMGSLAQGKRLSLLLSAGASGKKKSVYLWSGLTLGLLRCRWKHRGVNLATCVLSSTHPFLQLLTVIRKKWSSQLQTKLNLASLRYKHVNISSRSTQTIPGEAHILAKSLNTKDVPSQKFDHAHSMPTIFEIVSCNTSWSWMSKWHFYGKPYGQSMQAGCMTVPPNNTQMTYFWKVSQKHPIIFFPFCKRRDR